MEAQIKTTENGIQIDVTDLEGKKEQLLEAFQECSEGRCTCPTQEYQKVEALDILDSSDAIQLSIKAKAGQQIDTAEIEKCLEYTQKRASEESRPAEPCEPVAAPVAHAPAGDRDVPPPEAERLLPPEQSQDHPRL
ncbi:MAG TPA: hypothetical protein VF784_00070 [Anaerolineales bacterium]